MTIIPLIVVEVQSVIAIVAVRFTDRPEGQTTHQIGRSSVVTYLGPLYQTGWTG